MQPGPGRSHAPLTVLGVAGLAGASLWAVPLLALPNGLPPMASPAVLILLPSALGSLALALACGIWFGRRGRARTQAEALAASQARLALLQTQLRLAAERSRAEERRIAQLLECAAPGAALLDAGHRLVAWNAGFAAWAEVPEAALRVGLPVGDLLRLQPAGTGRHMPLRSIQAGIAGAARRQRGDGSYVEDRWSPGTDGGVLLTCRPALAGRPAGASPIGSLAALCAEEVQSRLVLLQAAIAVADLPKARMEAHAMRGVAANFGLDALAGMLSATEAAAHAGEQAGLAACMAALPELVAAALQSLAREVA